MDQLITEDPTRIGPYRLIARLGAGGMGLVYLGRSEGGRTVAVKVVQAEYAGNPDFRKRFAREVAAARRVGGSWTAAVLDADPEAAVPWVATQYIPGPDLHAVVAKDFGPLPEYSVHTLANRLALALQAVHEAGLIHRDLKPSNVLVTVDGPRVIDFGIARAMDSLAGDSLLTNTGMLIGSPGFMSPEQVRGLELTPASDVFCLGAVLVYAATGRLLFGAADTGLNAHLFRVAEEEADLTGVPEELLDLVRACLHKDPVRRPTPRQVAERTATDRAAEWLPGAVLAQLGRHAALLLDYAPAMPAETPAARPDPRVAPAQPQHQPQPRLQPTPPPPEYAPTAPGPFVPAQGFGPPPGPLRGWAQAPTEAPLQDSGSPYPGRWRGLAVAAVVQLMVVLSATVSGMGLSSVQHDLGLASGDLGPLFNLYWLVFGALLLLGGHVTDLVGRRRALIIGLAGFAAASVLGGAAAGPGMLLWARVLQGVFAALLTPAALSLLVAGFTDPKERGRAFGVYATIAGGGAALGLLAGGFLIDALNWRWCLYLAVPLAVIALLLTLSLPRELPVRTGARLDLLGTCLGSAALAALLYGFLEAGSRGWANVMVPVVLVVGGLLLGAFLWWQSRAAEPLLAPYVFGDRNRLGCLLAMLLAGIGFIILSTATTFHMTQVIGYGSATAGLLLLPVVAAVAIGSAVSALLLHRAAPQILIAAGLVLTAGGLLLLTGLEAGDAYQVKVLPGMLLTGVGIGLAFVPIFATATAAVAPRHAGAASAAVVTAQQLGEAVGAMLLGVAMESLRRTEASESVTEMIWGGYATALWWAFGAVLLGGLTGGLMVTSTTPRGAVRQAARAPW